MADQKQNHELELEKMDQVSGGWVNQKQVKAKGIRGWFGGKDTVYDVTDENSGQVVQTFNNLNDALKLDRRLNTNTRKD